MPQQTRNYAINMAGIAALYLFFFALIQSGLLSRYYQGILLMAGINIILAASLNLTTGFLGQLALGHAGFMSIGAYAAALLTKNMPGVPDLLRFPLALLAGGLLAGLFGLLIGIPALRLSGDYLAIITLGFGEIIRVLIENMGITGGGQGLTGIKRLTNFHWVFFVTVASVAVLYALLRSRQGRSIIAIREDRIAAQASGIRVTYYRTLAFVISAFFAGVAGGLFAHYIGILGAKNFGFAKSIDILVMVVLGGMGNFTGAIVAAAVITILTELLREFAQYRMVIYSLVLIFVMIFKPSGLMGRYEFSFTRVLDRLLRRREEREGEKEISTPKSGTDFLAAQPPKDKTAKDAEQEGRQ